MIKKDDKDYHNATNISSQVCHVGVAIQADLIKQKLPETNGGFKALNFGKYDPKMYTELATDNPMMNLMIC